MTAAQLEEIIRLKQHVREFGVRNAPFHAALDRILLEHVVDREMLAHIAHEVDRPEAREPFGVVDHSGRVGAGKVEKALELFVNSCGVVGDKRRFGKWALGHLAAGVADQPGTAADERDWTMSMSLEANQEHDDE